MLSSSDSKPIRNFKPAESSFSFNAREAAKFNNLKIISFISFDIPHIMRPTPWQSIAAMLWPCNVAILWP